ncbi:MAG: hypothetical protein P1U61_03110 [Legionellaceae bacterium]|nr:hypothetical protein [Legionellaceae bacterium]
MPNQTFSKQFIQAIDGGYLQEEYAQGRINAANTGSGGQLSRVFDKINIQPSKDELDILAAARQKGWIDFSKALCAQIKPIFDHLLSKDPTPFNIPDLTKEEIESLITPAIMAQYAGAITYYMADNNYKKDFQTDMNFAIGKIMPYLETPDDITEVLETGGVIQTNLDELIERDKERDFLKITDGIGDLLNATGIQRKALIAFRDTNEAILDEQLYAHIATAIGQLGMLHKQLEQSVAKLEDLTRFTTDLERLNQQLQNTEAKIKNYGDAEGKVAPLKQQKTLDILTSIIEYVSAAIGDFLAFCGYLTQKTIDRRAEEDLRENLSEHLGTLQTELDSYAEKSKALKQDLGATIEDSKHLADDITDIASESSNHSDPASSRPSSPNEERDDEQSENEYEGEDHSDNDEPSPRPPF